MKYKTTCILLLMIISTLTFGQSQNLFKIIENDKIGYINEKGNVVITPKYLRGNEFSDGLASVRLNSRYGFIDHSGQFIIQPKYDYVLNFNNGFACAYLNGKPLIIDKNDKVILDTLYKSIQFTSKGKVIIQTKRNKQGIFDLTTKKLVIDTIFQSISSFQNGIATVTNYVIKQDDRNTNYAVIDSLGNFVVPFEKYEKIEIFVDGYAKVLINNGKNGSDYFDGLIDTKGNLLFQRSRKNSSVSGNFNNGIAVINLYRYWTQNENNNSYEGYINTKGEIIFNDSLSRNLQKFTNDRTFLSDKKEQYYTLVDTKFKKISKDTIQRIQVNCFKNGFKNGFAVVETKNWVLVIAVCIILVILWQSHVYHCSGFRY